MKIIKTLKNIQKKEEGKKMQYKSGEHGFVKDFFERTKNIIESSDKIMVDGCEGTLLINCLLGILVFPEQKFYNEMSDSMLSDKNKQKIKQGIIGKSEPRTLKKIFRRMKNAVSHCNIKFESAYNNQIKYIYFYDDENYAKRNLENYEFQLESDVEDLREILFDFCENLLKNEKYIDEKEG